MAAKKNPKKAHTFVRYFGAYKATLEIQPLPHINPAHARWKPKMPDLLKRDAISTEYAEWMIESYRTAAQETGLSFVSATMRNGTVDGWIFRPDGEVGRLNMVTIPIQNEPRRGT